LAASPSKACSKLLDAGLGEARVLLVPPGGLGEQPLLVAVVLHDQRRIDAGEGGNAADGGALETGLREQLTGGVQDRGLGPLAALVPRQCRCHPFTLQRLTRGVLYRC